jgi:hypothetical protein
VPPPSQFATRQLDSLVEPLEKTLTARLKSDAVKQEVGGCKAGAADRTCVHACALAASPGLDAVALGFRF